MGENRTYKMVSVIALVLGVVGVTLGYAAFSNTLTISSSAEVTPDESNFNVDFSTANNSVVADPITPTLSPSTPVTGFEATNGVINTASDPTVTNLKATFTAPGQSVTYQFYAYNAGQIVAYLKMVEASLFVLIFIMIRKKKNKFLKELQTYVTLIQRFSVLNFN